MHTSDICEYLSKKKKKKYFKIQCLSFLSIKKKILSYSLQKRECKKGNFKFKINGKSKLVIPKF